MTGSRLRSLRYFGPSGTEIRRDSDFKLGTCRGGPRAGPMLVAPDRPGRADPGLRIRVRGSGPGLKADAAHGTGIEPQTAGGPGTLGGTPTGFSFGFLRTVHRAFLDFV